MKKFDVNHHHHHIELFQVNNYVIFSGFFKDQPASPMGIQQKKPRIYMGKLQYV